MCFYDCLFIEYGAAGVKDWCKDKQTWQFLHRKDEQTCFTFSALNTSTSQIKREIWNIQA